MICSKTKKNRCRWIQLIVKYSVLNDNKNLFASKYQLYLPTEEELVKEIEKQKEEFEDKK